MENRKIINDIFFAVSIFVGFGIIVQVGNYSMNTIDERNYKNNKIMIEKIQKEKYISLLDISQKLDGKLKEIKVLETRLFMMKNKPSIATRGGKNNESESFRHFKNTLHTQRFRFNTLANTYNTEIKTLKRKNNKIIIPEGYVEILKDGYMLLNDD